MPDRTQAGKRLVFTSPFFFVFFPFLLVTNVCALNSSSTALRRQPKNLLLLFGIRGRETGKLGEQAIMAALDGCLLPLWKRLIDIPVSKTDCDKILGNGVSVFFFLFRLRWRLYRSAYNAAQDPKTKAGFMKARESRYIGCARFRDSRTKEGALEKTAEALWGLVRSNKDRGMSKI